MIEEARAREEAEPLGIEYRAGSATNLHELGEGSFDLVVAVFFFNYLDTDETCQTMSQIFRALKSGGKLVFAVPHPAFPFLHRTQQSPFSVDSGSYGYFSGRDINHMAVSVRR